MRVGKKYEIVPTLLSMLYVTRNTWSARQWRSNSIRLVNSAHPGPWVFHCSKESLLVRHGFAGIMGLLSSGEADRRKSFLIIGKPFGGGWIVFTSISTSEGFENRNPPGRRK